MGHKNYELLVQEVDRLLWLLFEEVVDLFFIHKRKSLEHFQVFQVEVHFIMFEVETGLQSMFNFVQESLEVLFFSQKVENKRKNFLLVKVVE